MFSFIAAVVASLTMTFAKVVSDVNSKTGKILQIRDPHTHKLHNAPPVTAFQHGLARGFATVLPIPLVIGFTLLLSKPPAHRRTWYFGLVALFLLVFLAGGSQLYLPAVAFFGVGCWQARKAGAARGRGRPEGHEGAGARQPGRRSRPQGRRRRRQRRRLGPLAPHPTPGRPGRPAAQQARVFSTAQLGFFAVPKLPMPIRCWPLASR